MTSIKHGRYDAEKHLPNNSGTPQGNGLYVWFLQAVKQLPGGEALVEQCYAHVDGKYQWLLEQVEALNTPASRELLEQFHIKRKYLAAEARQEQRYRSLRGYQERLAERYNEWYEKQVAKLEREIAKAQEKWRFEREF